MPLVVFEPTISEGERPQTYALDRAATGTGEIVYTLAINKEKFPEIEVPFLLHVEISVTGRRRTLLLN